MRILPIQIDMVHLTGERLPDEPGPDTLHARAKRMHAAKDALMRATGRDYGYDIAKWHQYLISPQAPERIRDAYTAWSLYERWKPDSDWQHAVGEAERLAIDYPNCPRCGSFASQRRVAHGPPGAKEMMWLCSVCKKRTPISLGDGDNSNVTNET